jgi:hypothetical protein
MILTSGAAEHFVLDSSLSYWMLSSAFSIKSTNYRFLIYHILGIEAFAATEQHDGLL